MSDQLETAEHPEQLKRVVIEPLTRVEGHGKVTLLQDEDNRIRDEHLRFPTVAAGASDPSAGLTADLHRANFAEFIAALDDNRAPAISGAEARKAVDALLRIDPTFSASTHMRGLPLRDSETDARARSALKKAGVPD